MRLLTDLMIEPMVRASLLEDLGRGGDITSQALIPTATKWKAEIKAREKGVVAGLDLARLAFQLVDSSVQFESQKKDGAAVEAGSVLAVVSGSARSLLSAERVALNYLSHLSGIATTTNRFVEAVKPHKARICCTRKTTPNLRVIEKYAVQMGGGSNHRFGLDDAVMIKDNHLSVVGDLRQAVLKMRQEIGHMVKIELEVDSLDQLRLALDLPIDVVLLDNMSPVQLRQAVDLVGGRFITEASGRVSLHSVNEIAASGVDVISVGWITHSAPILDIGLDAVA